MTGLNGQTVVWGKLFRAGGLDELSNNDLSKLEKMGLVNVIGLRSTD